MRWKYRGLPPVFTHEFKLWLKDYLALYGVKNAVLTPGYRSTDKN